MKNPRSLVFDSLAVNRTHCVRADTPAPNHKPYSTASAEALGAALTAFATRSLRSLTGRCAPRSLGGTRYARAALRSRASPFIRQEPPTAPPQHRYRHDRTAAATTAARPADARQAIEYNRRRALVST